MSFGSLLLFPEDDESFIIRDRRAAPRSEHRAAPRHRREPEHHDDYERPARAMVDVAGAIVVGSMAAGFMGAMLKK